MENGSRWRIGLVLLFLNLNPFVSCVSIDKSDLSALKDLKSGFRAGKLPSWSSQNPCNQWQGVTCTSDGRVKILNLRNLNLGGSLRRSIAKLTKLVHLDVSGNNLVGKLPTSFSSALKLNSLYVQTNNFSGSIPSAIGKITTLKNLGLKNNLFTGSIPDSFKNLRFLTTLDVSNNKLSGTFPSCVGKMKLSTINLSQNQFYGRLPDSIYNSRIQNLDLSSNLFGGNISSNLNQLSQAKSLNFQGNFFTSLSQGLSDFFASNSYRKIKIIATNCIFTIPVDWPIFTTAPDLEQREYLECNAFCNSDYFRGACGGHGYCYLQNDSKSNNGSSTPACICDKGYKLTRNFCV